MHRSLGAIGGISPLFSDRVEFRPHDERIPGGEIGAGLLARIGFGMQRRFVLGPVLSAD